MKGTYRLHPPRAWNIKRVDLGILKHRSKLYWWT